MNQIQSSPGIPGGDAAHAGTQGCACLSHRPGYIGRSGSCEAAYGGCIMSWATPTLVEICIGLEINGYLPAEF
jgi:coenzyme PQQ precursor peptide PqqA